VGFSFRGRVLNAVEALAATSTPVPPPANEIDSWIVVSADGSVTVFSGKVELGTGVSTALRQIVAEELDVAFDKITWVQGDSDRTVDQGSTVGSQTVKRGGTQLRNAAAEARAVLVLMAAEKLAAPVASLTVSNGLVSVRDDPSRRVTYGDLIGGKRFEREVSGQSRVKKTATCTVVGQTIPDDGLATRRTG